MDGWRDGWMDGRWVGGWMMGGWVDGWVVGLNEIYSLPCILGHQVQAPRQ
jgi:hypothetical protein